MEGGTVSYGITSRLRVIDTDLDRVARKLVHLGKLGRLVGDTISSSIKDAFRGPRGVFAELDRYEQRVRALSRTQTFLERTQAMVARMDARGMRAANATEAARMRLRNGIADANLNALRPERQPRGSGGMAALGAAGALGGPATALAQATGMALYNATVGSIQTITSSLAETARVFHQVGVEAESAMVGIQAVFMSTGGIDPVTARSMAVRTQRRLERAAATGPGDAANYAEAFGRLYGPMAQAGANTAQIERMVALSIGAGEIERPGSGRVLGPMDVYQAMTSGLNARATPMVIRALNNVGVTPEQFRGASANEQINMMLRGFETFGGAIEVYGQTVASQTDTLADNLKRFIRAVEPRAFDAFRGGLLESNRILDDLNEENSHFRDGARLITDVLARGAADVGAGFRDGLLRYLPEIGSRLTSLGEQLGFVVGDLKGFGESLGFIVSRMATMMIETASFAAQVGGATAETSPYLPQAFRLAYGAAVGGRRWYNAPRLPGFAEDGTPLSLLAPGREMEDGIPEMLRKPEKFGAAVGDAAGDRLSKSRQKIDINANVNVVWGDDRSLAISLRNVIEDVAQQIAATPRMSFASPIFREG